MSLLKNFSESSEKNYFHLNGDEIIFGTKRTLLIEQLNCKRNNELRDELLRVKLVAAINEASEKIQKENEAKSNWVVVGSSVAEAINNMTVDEYLNFRTGDTEDNL